MSEPVADTLSPAGGLREAAAGCHGKIPSRGDFLRLGLPRDFVEAWDAWMIRVLSASRSALGEDWVEAWLEAPIWRFALAPGVCGAGAAIGLWMPSVDRVGRHFPLTLAAIVPAAEPAELIRAGGGFLEAAERAGLDAIETDLPPAALLARTIAAAGEPPGDAGVDPALGRGSGALWWTAGAPRRPSGAIALPGLPDEPGFAAMLDARVGSGS